MKKSKYQPLFDLEPEKLDRIDNWLRQGTSPKMVAKRVHADLEELHSISERTLARLLASYKADIIDRNMLKQMAEAGVLERVQKNAGLLNLFDEMMLSITAQRERMARALKAAENLPESLLIEQHGREIERYNRMVSGGITMQMEMGIIPRVPKRIQGSIARDPDNPNVLKFEVSESMIEAVTELEQLLGPEVIDGTAVVTAGT